MISSIPIDDASFNQIVTYSISNVFRTMLDFPVELTGVSTADKKCVSDDCLPRAHAGAPLVVGNVGIVGKITGMVYLYMTQEFGARMTTKLLGMDPTEAPDDDIVNDVVGEICNMVVGQFKNQLDEKGLACRLTIPSILRGSDFVVEPIRAAERQVFFFKSGFDHLAYDILMRPGEDSKPLILTRHTPEVAQK